MKYTSRDLSFLLLVFLFLFSACQASVSRNDDGSLTVETFITQAELQTAITAAIADPLITELNVSLQSGYALVNGTRQRLNDPSKNDTLSFRLDLGMSNGQLTATVSEALLDGRPMEQNRVDHWNETIASRLLIGGKKNPNSSIQSVSFTPEAVMMSWVVSK